MLCSSAYLASETPARHRLSRASISPPWTSSSMHLTCRRYHLPGFWKPRLPKFLFTKTVHLCSVLASRRRRDKKKISCTSRCGTVRVTSRWQFRGLTGHDINPAARVIAQIDRDPRAVSVLTRNLSCFFACSRSCSCCGARESYLWTTQSRISRT